MGGSGDRSQSHWGLSVGPHVRLRKIGPLCFLLHKPLVIRMFPEVSDGADFVSGNCPESWWGACRCPIWMLLLCAVLSPLGAQQKVRAPQLDVQGTAGRPPLSLHPAQSPAHTTAHAGLLCLFTHPLSLGKHPIISLLGAWEHKGEQASPCGSCVLASWSVPCCCPCGLLSLT